MRLQQMPARALVTQALPPGGPRMRAADGAETLDVPNPARQSV